MLICNRSGAETSFAQVFKVVELLGNEWAKDQLVHIPYGLVSLEGAKLSTRSGNIIYAEDILKDAIAKSLEIITEKSPNLPNKEDVAKKVGVGAVLFNDLYNQRIKDVSLAGIRFSTLMVRQVLMFSIHMQDAAAL